ncbi:hypothetical protein ACLOJK_003698 [Asimina triloba]
MPVRRSSPACQFAQVEPNIRQRHLARPLRVRSAQPSAFIAPDEQLSLVPSTAGHQQTVRLARPVNSRPSADCLAALHPSICIIVACIRAGLTAPIVPDPDTRLLPALMPDLPSDPYTCLYPASAAVYACISHRRSASVPRSACSTPPAPASSLTSDPQFPSSSVPRSATATSPTTTRRNPLTVTDPIDQIRSPSVQIRLASSISRRLSMLAVRQPLSALSHQLPLTAIRPQPPTTLSCRPVESSFGEEGGAPYYGAPATHVLRCTLSIIRYSSSASDLVHPHQQ